VDKLLIVFHRLWISARGAAQNGERKREERKEKEKEKREEERKKEAKKERSRVKRKRIKKREKREREHPRSARFARWPPQGGLRVTRARGKQQKVKGGE